MMPAPQLSALRLHLPLRSFTLPSTCLREQNVYDKRPEWDADACVRRAIGLSQVPSPVGRKIIHAVPGWPSPQALVTSGLRYRTHVSCVLLFQSEPHVPIAVEALPWETPSDLVRFAPPHLGLVGVTACVINGFEGQCDHRLPHDTDWIELRVDTLTASEARRCVLAWSQLPSGEVPRVPLSWTQAGYFPRHGFPINTCPSLAGVFEVPTADDDDLGNSDSPVQRLRELAGVVDPLHPEGADGDNPGDASDTSCEDYFSSSHSGGLVCNRVDFP